MGFNFFSRDPPSNDPIQLAINKFSALTLPKKADAIGNAIIKLEEKLERNGRKLGHPGDWPRDYHSEFGRHLLNLGHMNPECDNDRILLSVSCSANRLIQRSGISTPDFDICYPKYAMGNILVIATESRKNRFLSIINIYEHLSDSISLSVNIEKIYSYQPLVEHLQSRGAYTKVFIASSTIAAPQAPQKNQQYKTTKEHIYDIRKFRYNDNEKYLHTFAIEMC